MVVIEKHKEVQGKQDSIEQNGSVSGLVSVCSAI